MARAKTISHFRRLEPGRTYPVMPWGKKHEIGMAKENCLHARLKLTAVFVFYYESLLLGFSILYTIRDP